MGLIIAVFLISGCVPSNITDVRTSIGDEYHVLKLPTMQHNIGSEWSKQFNATGKGALSEDKIRVEKSLKQLDRGTAHEVAVGIAALSNSGLSGGVGIDAEILKQINMSNLQVVKPVSLGYIAFKPGINYVTEALRLEGFSIDDEKRIKLQASVTGSDSPDRSSANFGVGAAGNSGMSGEGLVIGYVVQTVDNATYRKEESGPVDLTLDSRRVQVGGANISAAASFEKVVAGSGKSLPKSLLWACRRAASRKDAINAAWVVTLALSGEEKKTLKIAFPAHPEIEDCSEFEGVVTTGINSVTDQIERTTAHIVIDRASVTEMIAPAEFSATISATKESFKVKTVYPES